MRLLTVNMERYGCFTGKELHFRPDAALHLVYGENEAGKSTSLAAITDLLFSIESRTPYDYQHPGQLSLGGTIRGDDGKDFSFKRRKGTKITLTDTQGKPLPEDSLAPYLHALTRSAFCSAFGMNAQSLREGATEMLKSGGDSGVSLFAAASGVRGLLDLQKRLEERADLIFAPRRSANRTFYQILDRLTAAKEQVRQLELKDRDLRDLREQIEAADRTVRELRTRRSTAVAQRERLLRHKDIAPLLHLITADERALGPRTELPEWDRSRIRALRDAYAGVQEMERIHRERIEEEAGIRLALDGNTVDLPLLVEAEEIESLFGQTGNYASQEKDLPRVRDESRGYNQDLTDVARRLGLKNAEDLPSRQPTDGIVARIRNLAGTGRDLQQQLSEKDRAISEYDEKVRDLKQQEAASSAVLDCETQRKRFENLSPVLNRLPEIRRLEATVSTAERSLSESASQASPAITDMETLAFTSLPAMEVINGFIAEVDEDSASRRSFAAQEKAAISKVADMRRRLAAITTGAALGSPEQIATARQVRESLWTPLRSVLLLSRSFPPPQEILKEVTSLERSTSDADRLADSAVTDAERVAEYSALTLQLKEDETALAGVRQQIDDLLLGISAREERWKKLWSGCPFTPGTPREMAAWLSTVQSLLKERTELRNKRAELEGLRSAINAVRPALNDVARTLQVPDAEQLSHELAATAVDSALRVFEEKEGEARRLRTLLVSADERLKTLLGSQTKLRTSLQEWTAEWQEAMKSFHFPLESSVEEAEAALSAWGEFPALLRERNSRQRRIDGIERDMKAFEDRLSELFARLGKAWESTTTYDAAARLLNKQLKLAQSAEAAVTQLKMQMTSAANRKQLASDALGQASGELETQLLGLPVDRKPTELIEQLELREEVLQRVSQRRESLIPLSQGESEQSLREILAEFSEDDAAGKLQELQDDELRLTDEMNESYAEWKGLTEKLEKLTKGVGAEAAVQLCRNAEAELLQSARTWAVYRLGQLLLSRGVEEHRTQNQQPLMRRAGELFQMLTGGSYVGVEEELDEKDSPRLVGRRDAEHTVHIEGMSKGTRDQLYLSLRLAYLEEYASKAEAVPFIGDDLLTSSDEKRTTRGLQALAATGKQIQPILFTHHLRVVELAKDALGSSLDIIDLR